MSLAVAAIVTLAFSLVSNGGHGFSLERHAYEDSNKTSEDISRIFPYADSVDYHCPPQIQQENVSVVFIRYDRGNDAIPYPRRDMVLRCDLTDTGENGFSRNAVVLYPEIQTKEFLSAIEWSTVLPAGVREDELSVECLNGLIQEDGSLMLEWHVHFSQDTSVCATFLTRIEMATFQVTDVFLTPTHMESANLMAGAGFVQPFIGMPQVRKSPLGHIILETEDVIVEMPLDNLFTCFSEFDSVLWTQTTPTASLHRTGSRSVVLSLVSGNAGWELTEFRGKRNDGQRPGKILASSSFSGALPGCDRVRAMRHLRIVKQTESVAHVFLAADNDSYCLARMKFTSRGDIGVVEMIELPSGLSGLRPYPITSADGTVFCVHDEDWVVSLLCWPADERSWQLMPLTVIEPDRLSVSYVSAAGIRFHDPEDVFYFEGNPELRLQSLLRDSNGAVRELFSLGRKPGLELKRESRIED